MPDSNTSKHYDTQHGVVVEAVPASDVVHVRDARGNLQPFLKTDFDSRFPKIKTDEAKNIGGKTVRYLTLDDDTEYQFDTSGRPSKVIKDALPNDSRASHTVPQNPNLKPVNPTPVVSEGSNLS